MLGDLSDCRTALIPGRHGFARALGLRILRRRVVAMRPTVDRRSLSPPPRCKGCLMPEITLRVPDAMPVALRVPRERLGGELLLAAAVKLYEAGRLSSGAAAELAGLPKPVFLQKLGEFGVATFRQDADELREEFA